jgi:hypothetical protein
MNALKGCCAAIVDLLVEDGWIASGTIVALALTGLSSLLLRFDHWVFLIGPELFILLMALLVSNLFFVARRLRD